MLKHDLFHPFYSPLNTGRIAIIGPGRLGTAFAYKFGRENKDIMLYYHDADLCKTMNSEHLNPKHLTGDLERLLGSMDRVPRLSEKVCATSDLEQVIEGNDFILLALTMDRLPGILNGIRFKGNLWTCA